MIGWLLLLLTKERRAYRKYYSLTAWAEAGLPDSETIFQSRPNPISSKIFTS
jgi:hypothetical protein